MVIPLASFVSWWNLNMPRNSALKRQLVVTPKLVIPIDLTKWNRSHCWLNIVLSMHYQRKKRRKQIESWCGTGTCKTNQRKSVWNNFQQLKYKLSVWEVGAGGGIIPQDPPQSILVLFDIPRGLQKRSLIAFSLPLLQGFSPAFVYFQLFKYHMKRVG